MFDFLKGLGVIGVLITILILLFLPLIVTIIVGVAIANHLRFTGIIWWSFVILFYIVITSILSANG